MRLAFTNLQSIRQDMLVLGVSRRLLTRRSRVRNCPTMLFLSVWPLKKSRAGSCEKVESRISWKMDKMDKFVSKTKAAGGRESKACEEMERWKMRTHDLRKHRYLWRNIRFETSGATAKSHGSTFVSVELKSNVQRLKRYSAISTITEAFGSVDSIRSLTTYVCGEETSKNDV